MALVRVDERGPYIVTNGARYRPGPLWYGLRTGLRSDAEGLTVGTKVKVAIISGTPVVRIMPEGHEMLHWESEETADQASNRGSATPWDWIDGRNVPRETPPDASDAPLPRIITALRSDDVDAIASDHLG